MKVKSPPTTGITPEVAQWMREVMAQLNALSECRITATYGAMTAAPTTGTWLQGDFVPNSAPVETGMTLAKYIITGWKCVASGAPGTWVQVRTLTGN